jgi:hypothetical protein
MESVSSWLLGDEPLPEVRNSLGVTEMQPGSWEFGLARGGGLTSVAEFRGIVAGENAIKP